MKDYFPLWYRFFVIMDGPSGLNQPRRKSRLRSRENEYVRRPAASTPATEAEEALSPVDGPPAYDPGLETDPDFARTATTVDGLTEAPPHERVPAASDPEIGGSEGDDEELPEAFRLNKVYTETPARNPLTDWRWLVPLAALLGAALGGGYLLGQRAVPPQQGVSPRTMYTQGVRSVLGPILPEVQAEVDDAFEATKHGRYEEARQRFVKLHDKHPEWPSMAVESARDSLYERDAQTAQTTLGILSTNRVTPDADFMLALLHLTNQEYDLAETAFGMACALDPARPEYYYFWGDCLRRDGKPQEAIDKFRAALLRNQYENAEGLYQLKLWLSEIQADKEEASGAGKEIDAALNQPRPSYEALFAAAGRAIKVGRFSDAADFVRKAQDVTEPSVFRVILQDPTFLEESTRSQLAEFYR